MCQVFGWVQKKTEPQFWCLGCLGIRLTSFKPCMLIVESDAAMKRLPKTTKKCRNIAIFTVIIGGGISKNQTFLTEVLLLFLQIWGFEVVYDQELRFWMVGPRPQSETFRRKRLQQYPRSFGNLSFLCLFVLTAFTYPTTQKNMEA